jgi:hypothetical protein
MLFRCTAMQFPWTKKNPTINPVLWSFLWCSSLQSGVDLGEADVLVGLSEDAFATACLDLFNNLFVRFYSESHCVTEMYFSFKAREPTLVDFKLFSMCRTNLYGNEININEPVKLWTITLLAAPIH